VQEEINKPIFVVGSPRSGTSILTWCLGQHPNIFPVPESNWLGQFALNIAIGHQIGTARGDRTILSAMEIQRDELFVSFGQTINNLILSHRPNLERKRKMTRPQSEPKTCWVDGTPEYSFYICGLRKLFPQALFVHLVRDVTTVVRSLLNFFPDGRNRLVANEEAAYEYWLRRATHCFEAEQAYGPAVVYRVRYSDLVGRSESTMRSLLEFLGEPYAPECLEPLVERINSANVPANFNEREPQTDPAIMERAKQLSNQLQNSPQLQGASARIAEKLGSEFDQRVQYFLNLERNYSEAQKMTTKLQKELEAIKTSPMAEGDRPC
jgi:sulfotransferase family protein